MKRAAPRKEELLNLLLEGMSNREIAKKMRISELTVKHYFNWIYNSYGISNGPYCARVQLAAEVLYRRRPDLIPFNGGDRASQLGFKSAQEFVR